MGRLTEAPFAHIGRSDTLPEQDAEALWLDVAERRAQEIDEGKVQLVAPDELECRVQAHFK
jgi:hypothetical protein